MSNSLCNKYTLLAYDKHVQQCLFSGARSTLIALCHFMRRGSTIFTERAAFKCGSTTVCTFGEPRASTRDQGSARSQAGHSVNWKIFVIDDRPERFRIRLIAV